MTPLVYDGLEVVLYSVLPFLSGPFLYCTVLSMVRAPRMSIYSYMLPYSS
jgi:hypothetical protein